VRKISSPQRVANVSNLCNGQRQWARSMGNMECRSGFGKRVCQLISGKSSMTRDPLEAQSYIQGCHSNRKIKFQDSFRSFSWTV